jgi:hypothetical protein
VRRHSAWHSSICRITRSSDFIEDSMSSMERSSRASGQAGERCSATRWASVSERRKGFSFLSRRSTSRAIASASYSEQGNRGAVEIMVMQDRFRGGAILDRNAREITPAS